MSSSAAQERAATAACVLVLLLVIGVDVTVHDLALSGSYGLAAVLAGAVLGVRQTIAIGCAATSASALSFLWNDNPWTAEWAARLLVATAFSVAALGIAIRQENRERRLLQMTVIAETAQRAVLRSMPTAVGPVGFAARYVSAAEAARIGGDLYEVVETRFGTRAIVGDVRGKGLDAVQLAATVLGSFRRAATTAEDLVDLADELDAVVSAVAGIEDFVTAVLVQFRDDGCLEVANLGHVPPIVVGGPMGVSARVMDTGEPVPPLGLHPEPTVVRDTWAPGMRLLLYTDGTSESRDDQGRFFEVSTQAALLSGGTLDEALDRLIEALTRHVGHHLTDDVALVLAERRGLEPSSNAGA